jgi:hypothetical protein
MSLKKTVADTPDVGILQKVFGKTIEIIEIVAVVVVAIIIANLLGFG